MFFWEDRVNVRDELKIILKHYLISVDKNTKF